MLKLQATSFSNQPVLQALDAEFDELGGSIGRSEGNTLILHDEKRYISRTQASISFRGGVYYLRDHGSASPTFVNGSPVGNGNEVALRDGDELRIGEYVLVAHVGGAAPDLSDPFADLLPKGAAVAVQPAPYAMPAARSNDPFDDPFGLPPAASPAASPGVIPQDFDPFADLMPQAASAAAPVLTSLAPASAGSVDDLFGLGQPNTWDPLASHAPSAGTDALPQDASGMDPFADLAPKQANRAQKLPQRDDAPMLSSALPRPQPQPAPVAAQNGAARDTARAQPEPLRPQSPTHDMVVSWDTSHSPHASNEIRTIVVPSPKRPAAVAQQPAPEAPAPAAAAPRAAPTAPAASASAAPEAAAPQPDALLQAFLDGAGMPALRIPGGLTPELMNLIGRLMHESIRGTLDLLLARALTKREVRARSTMIVARENNQLKFSPTVEAAFNNLLAPHGQGFMQPADAMRDAYNDLRSHQFGLMAGMRAALEGVLARFDPAHLEARLTHKSVLGALVPASRRARLWELYEHLYRDISKEAQDDFQTLFGKEFLRAYQAQIDKLDQEDAAIKR
jgi:predicted component of type VI protein secretion system